MSIQDLYERIYFGVAGTIKEVHFIGHAWIGGPIIVNTPDYERKNYDKDGRANDFTFWPLKHVFDSTNLPKFRASLTSDAFFVIWGCDNHWGARQLLIHGMAKEARGDSFQAELASLKSLLKGTYAAQLATASGKEVCAPLPGTYAVHEGERNDDPSGWSYVPTVMHVNMTFFPRILEFYRKNLGISFPTTGVFKGHPTFGRGYARYFP